MFREILTEGTLTSKQVEAIRKAVKEHNEKYDKVLVGSKVLCYARKLKPYSVVFKYLKDPSEDFYNAVENCN